MLPAMSRLDAIGVVVSDMQRGVEFFRLLGVPFGDPGENAHFECKLDSGVRLMLDTETLVRSFMPNWVKPEGQRLSLAFLQDSPKAVDERVERLRAAGFEVDKEPWDAFWGQRYATVKNADGLAVDLFAPL
jgi:uncharacterized glyoxalase superfamily protein PhnB